MSPAQTLKSPKITTNMQIGTIKKPQSITLSFIFLPKADPGELSVLYKKFYLKHII